MVSPPPRWLVCEVPFCVHKRGNRKGSPPITADMSWICGAHWRQVPTLVRRRLKKLDRLVMRAEAKGDAWLVQRFRWKRHQLWLEARVLAIEIAAGITARQSPGRKATKTPPSRK